MPLDFEKVKAASSDDLVSLALCEFSRAVDAVERIAGALERIAPSVADLEAAASANSEPPAAPTCPHPAELRLNTAAMGQEPFSTFRCGVCGAQVAAPAPEGVSHG
jgi:hypothetical protein